MHLIQLFSWANFWRDPPIEKLIARIKMNLKTFLCIFAITIGQLFSKYLFFYSQRPGFIKQKQNINPHSLIVWILFSLGYSLTNCIDESFGALRMNRWSVIISANSIINFVNCFRIKTNKILSLQHLFHARLTKRPIIGRSPILLKLPAKIAVISMIQRWNEWRHDWKRNVSMLPAMMKITSEY